MQIESDIKFDFSDVLIRPKRSALSSRSEVSLFRKYKFKHSGWEYVGIPIMAANMDTVGTFEMADALEEQGLFTCVHKHYDEGEWNKWLWEKNSFRPAYTAVTTGTSDADLLKLEKILRNHIELPYICVDVANGYTQRFVDTIKRLREKYPSKTIIAGNVVTREMTEELILSGADMVKVGIGPGSVCTTRIQAGVGYPQLSAIIECADAAHGLGGHVIADGGCTCPGDVAKAFGAGADFVMLGGMLAGHDEGGGEIITKWYETDELIIVNNEVLGNLKVEKKFVQFYGMSSDTAMNKHHGGVAEYRSSEGKTVMVPYRGPVKQTVQDILGGLRSACTYVGASNLKDLSKCTTFVRVNNQYNRIFQR